jgi:tryptophan 2,3-dioxygenase
MNGEHAADQQLTYGDYLRIPELLALQRPLASPAAHDELLFIIIHQTYELWFKLLLHELDGVTANLRAAARVPASREEVYEAARLLRRCTEIARLLVQQFTVLETMLPTHFLAFRDRLRPASGFQSEQFREIEFLCGLKDEALLSLHEPTPEMHAALTRRLKEPSLREVFAEALAALGIIPHMPGDAGEGEHSRAKALAIVALYRSESSHRDWIDVCERLSEFDELMVAWRLRHIQMVERTIGMKGGTGGSSGVSYLRSTLDKKFFPELWEARSLMSEGHGN